MYQLHEAIEERKHELQVEKDRIQREIAEGKENADVERAAEIEEQLKQMEQQNLQSLKH